MHRIFGAVRPNRLPGHAVSPRPPDPHPAAFRGPFQGRATCAASPQNTAANRASPRNTKRLRKINNKDFSPVHLSARSVYFPGESLAGCAWTRHPTTDCARRQTVNPRSQQGHAQTVCANMSMPSSPRSRITCGGVPAHPRGDRCATSALTPTRAMCARRARCSRRKTGNVLESATGDVPHHGTRRRCRPAAGSRGLWGLRTQTVAGKVHSGHNRSHSLADERQASRSRAVQAHSGPAHAARTINLRSNMRPE